jgi:hypothetical protein
MKTAVEWLVNQMKQRESQGLTLSIYELEMFAEQANKIFEEQMMDAFNDGVNDESLGGNKTPEKYYKETFKSE